MPSFTFTSPEGKQYTVNGPDGATKEQAFQILQGQLAGSQQPVEQIPTQPETPKQNAGTLANIGMGALKGASDIGATLRAPLDMAQDWVNRMIPNPAMPNEQPTNQKRRADVAGFFQNNADPQSLAFQGGALASQIAGTAGVGGAAAKGVMAASKVVPALANVAPKLATALESGGFKIGQKATTLPGKLANAAIRTGAGATVGGIQAGMVNPEDAGAGALIGGAMPGALKVAGEAGKLAKKGTSALVSNVLGATTGTGADAVRVAYQSGKAGNQAFLDNMRGKVPFDDVVDQAKAGLQTMRGDMLDAYKVAKNGSTGWAADTTPLDFSPIEQSFNKALGKYSFKGVLNPGVNDVADKVNSLLNTWKMNAKADPSFLSAEGLDALKRQLSDIYPSDMNNRAGRAFLTEVNNSVKKSITDQVPQYADAMRNYWKSAEQLDEIERSLSLGDRATKDTAIRKLQSLLRNNVSTNYGNRLKSAQALAERGGQDVLPAIAGQSMNSLMPRGMVGQIEKGAFMTAPFWAPGALLAAPAAMPRVVGESAYRLGRASGGVGTLASSGKRSAGQLGLLNQGLLSQEQAILRSLPLLTLSNQ